MFEIVARELRAKLLGRRRGQAGLRGDTPSHAQQHSTAGVEGAGGSGGPGCGGRGRQRGLAGQHTNDRPRPIGGRREACGAWPRCRWAAAGPAGQRGDASSHTQQPGATGVEGAGGTCRGAGGRRRGLAGLRDDAPSRRLAARTARGRAAAHGHTKQPGPAGQHARRPEHQRSHKQQLAALQAAPLEHAQKEIPTAPGTP